jgi:release factor glutamine methyltransferase
MTIKEAGKNITDTLINIYDLHEATTITDLVIEHLTGISRNDKIKYSDIQFTADEQKLNQMLIQLNNHRPVQYVLNEAWFYGLKLEVNESVLIPRPETEELVDWIVKDVRSKKYEVRRVPRRTPSSDGLKGLSILDIGTGSGCIPITLKKNLPQTEVSAIDVCSEALHTAINNAVNQETEINFQLLDFLNENKWNELGMYDIIVSNPPYIKNSEAKTMSQHVLDYEPHKALFVPDEDGLLFYRKIADFALTHLNSNGVVYLEINQQLGKETAELFQQKGFTVELKKDMSGNERMVKACREK